MFLKSINHVGHVLPPICYVDIRLLKVMEPVARRLNEMPRLLNVYSVALSSELSTYVNNLLT